MPDSLDRCWSRVGVAGDASCDLLPAMGHCRNCEQYSRAGRALFDREAPEALRGEWSLLLAEGRDAAATPGEPALVFQVNGEYLALYMGVLERVTDQRPLHSIPGRSGPLFTGIVNMDGELLPCFSAPGALQPDAPTPAANSGRILVLYHAGVRLACSVDRVVGIVHLSAADLEKPPVTLAGNVESLITALFPVQGHRAGLLDSEKFIQRLTRSAVT
jgi:chemotaxis-related protein WspD